MNGVDGPVHATISDTAISNHPSGWPAIASNGAAAKIVVSRSTIVDNGSVAFYQLNGATFESLGDNTVRNNNAGAAQTLGTITSIGPL